MNSYTTLQGFYPVIESRSKPEHFNNKSASIYEANTFDPVVNTSPKFVLRHVNTETEEVRETIVDREDYLNRRFFVGSYPEGDLHVYRY